MAKLNFKYGAMNAGKSTILMQTAYNYEERNQKVLLVKPTIDTKGDNKVVSRLGIERNVDILLNKDESLLDKKYFDMLKNVDCILVDECQFLTVDQVDDLLKITKLLDIPVICYGLRSDFRSEGFEGSMRLLNVADELEEMPTICECGKKARFNARIVNNEYTLTGNSIEIDDNAKIEYKSLCGKCYQTKVKKLSLKKN